MKAPAQPARLSRGLTGRGSRASRSSSPSSPFGAQPRVAVRRNIIAAAAGRSPSPVPSRDRLGAQQKPRGRPVAQSLAQQFSGPSDEKSVPTVQPAQPVVVVAVSQVQLMILFIVVFLAAAASAAVLPLCAPLQSGLVPTQSNRMTLTVSHFLGSELTVNFLRLQGAVLCGPRWAVAPTSNSYVSDITCVRAFRWHFRCVHTRVGVLSRCCVFTPISKLALIYTVVTVRVVFG